MLPYATLALGSALAAFMYPHTLTGVFASKSANTIRKNAVFLPAYTLLLGLIALLGYMAFAANIKVASPNDVVPALFKALFPSWFAGFAFSAIAIGALVPAAVMSIGAANLFTRNVWKSYVNPYVTHAGEARVAKITSLVVKVRRARPSSCCCRRNMRSICNCSAACGSCRRSLRWYLDCSRAGSGRRLCCSAGRPVSAGGSWTAWSNGLKPLATINLGGVGYSFYVGLGALILNIAVAVVATIVLAGILPKQRRAAAST